MTIFASKEDNPDTAEPAFKQEQVLNEVESSTPIEDGEVLVFNVRAKFEMGRMGDCDGDYKYLCMRFTKGDNPSPDFDWNTGMAFQKCENVNIPCNDDGDETGLYRKVAG